MVCLIGEGSYNNRLIVSNFVLVTALLIFDCNVTKERKRNVTNENTIIEIHSTCLVCNIQQREWNTMQGLRVKVFPSLLDGKH